MGKKMMFATSAKAERELGWKIVPVNDALAPRGGVVSSQRICLGSPLWLRSNARCAPL